MISQKKTVFKNTEKHKQFGLVWGLLKYHHSQVSKGNYHWGEIIVSNLEHHANIGPWKRLADKKALKLRVIPVKSGMK